VYCDRVAGVKYHDAQLLDIKAGDEITMRWERNNTFDPNAIALYHGDSKVGYIQAIHTNQLHQYRTQGIKLTARVKSYYPQNPSYHALVVEVLAPSIFNTSVDF
jgi:hypothetical protein